MGKRAHQLCLIQQAQACLAGDSAGYERRASGLDDVVIISALRTPMCKVGTEWSSLSVSLQILLTIAAKLCMLQAKRGALKDCPADDMLAAVLQATVDRTGVDPKVRRQAHCLTSNIT